MTNVLSEEVIGRNGCYFSKSCFPVIDINMLLDFSKKNKFSEDQSRIHFKHDTIAQIGYMIS